MDESSWECSVCTFENKAEAFKCQICDTRKGTSTRKPRVTPSIVAQQIASSFPPIPPALLAPSNNKFTKVQTRKRKSSSTLNKLKNLDISSGEKLEITVDGVTITITDYALDTPKTEDGPEPTYETEAKRSSVDVNPNLSNAL